MPEFAFNFKAIKDFSRAFIQSQLQERSTQPHLDWIEGAIVHHLVELHGGSAWAESPGEGQGALRSGSRYYPTRLR